MIPLSFIYLKKQNNKNPNLLSYIYIYYIQRTGALAMTHAAESCGFLETFGEKLTMPVRTRSRLKHILLENKFGKDFMEYPPFIIEDVEFHYNGDGNNQTTQTQNNNNIENIYNNDKPRSGNKNKKSSSTMGRKKMNDSKIGLNILGRASLF